MATRDLSIILVVDVEATCWEPAPPPGQVSDIIEIGITTLKTSTMEIGPSRSILVKPTRSTVSEFCTNLTTLTQADVDQGVSLLEACEILRKEFRSHERTWASYGDYDRKMFDNCCRSIGVRYPFGPRHLNIKNLFALAENLPKEIGMPGALDRLNIKLRGTHHRGGDDSGNIAKILASVLRAYGAGAKTIKEDNYFQGK